MKTRLLLSLLFAGTLAACGRNAVRIETRTFALRYLDAGRARAIVSPYVDADRPGAAGAINETMGALTVRETPENLDRIGRVLAQYDRPQPGVRLTFSLIQADGASRGDSSIREIESVLRPLFRFRGYALVADAMVTGSPDSQSGQMLAGSGGPYELSTMIERISGSGDSAIVHLRVHLAYHGGAFSTTVGIPVGKTAVLGNVRGGPPSSALILTVRPELVEP
jgi:hypothetical protein